MGQEFSSVNATYYFQTRTTYCRKMFFDIQQQLKLDETSRVLDVGAGTGQASLPFVQIGCQTTLIEPSKGLAEFLNNYYHSNPRVTVLNQAYENVCINETYDMVIAGTSFHWLNSKTKYEKVHQCLSECGHLVLFWSRPDFTQGSFWKRIMDIKNSYCKKSQSSKIEENILTCFRMQRAEISNSCFFNCIRSKIYRFDEKYTEVDICNLFDTFVDVMELTKDIKEQFHKDLQNCMHEYTAPFRLAYYSDLYICQKC